MFKLNEEQRIIQKSVQEFAEKELTPRASYWDSQEEFPRETVKKMAEIGLTGIRLPQAYGGSGTDLVTTGIVLEEVARSDHNCAIILCGLNITGRVLLHGSERTKDTYLRDIAKGKCILAFAATEAEAGSEVRAIQTVAEYRNGTYAVTGEKSMITFAGVADAFLVLAKTDTKNREGISCLLVKANQPGIDIQGLQGFGWKATKWGNVAFDHVQVPKENLIGDENQALFMLKPTIQEQRAYTGLIAVGTARQALNDALRYAKIRKVFGKPLGKFEGIQFRLAEDSTALEATRLLCYQALGLIEEKADEAPVWAAMANLLGGETAYRAVNTAMDVFGGIGYSRELPLERYLRDVKAVQIASATLKMEIAQGLLGKEFLPYA